MPSKKLLNGVPVVSGSTVPPVVVTSGSKTSAVVAVPQVRTPA